MTENNPNLIKESIVKSLSKASIEEMDSIFIEDSTESTNDNAKEYLKNQEGLFSIHQQNSKLLEEEEIKESGLALTERIFTFPLAGNHQLIILS